MKLKLNDTVRLLQALPDESLPEGAIGVVVEEYSQPEEAYGVEFCNEDGATVAQMALRPAQLELVS